MNKKFITLITLLAFTFVTLFSPFPGPSSQASAQSVTNTSSLRLVTTPATTTASLSQNHAAITPEPAKSMSVCKFIDLLASINAVTADRANSARVAMGCTTVAPVITPPTQAAQGGMAICSFIDLLANIGIVDINRANSARSTMGCAVNNNAPYVIVRANNSSDPISVLPGTQFRLSWHSENTRSCSDGKTSWPASGSILLVANTSLSYPVSCIGINGQTVTNSVTVIVANNQNATTSIQVLSSNITPGYDYAVFDATTNVPTKMVVGYTNNPAATSSVKIYESISTTTHSDKITGLLPNTAYYANVLFIANDNDKVMTPNLTFTTLSDSSLANSNNELTQRVLSSSGGNGVVSISGSESLKTDTKVTLEAWVKPTSWSTAVGMSNTSDSVIISKGKIGGHIDYVLSLDNGKLVYSNNDASMWTCSPVVPLNRWTNVAVSVNEFALSVNLYVNGVKQNSICEGPRGVFSASTHINKANAITEYVATTTNYSTGGWNSTSGTSNASADSWSAVTPSPSAQTVQSLLPNNYTSAITSNVYLGNFYPDTCRASSTTAAPKEGNGFIGLIDDVKIWNTARTADQIKADIATTSATSTATSTASLINTSPDDSSLVGHWSFDDGRATDLTVNMNNGALKGDMEIVDDATALSPVVGSAFALSGMDFNFPETCDANLYPDNSDKLVGYELTFKGGVKSVTPSGKFYIVELETCDNPTEDLVKSVKVIGNAPPRDASYYNSMGTISVVIVPSFNMKVPAVKDTIQGTSLDYITNPVSATVVVPKGTNSNANSAGYATNWQPQPGSCMKKDKGMMGNFAIIGAVVLVVAAALSCVYAGCAFVPLLTSAGTFAAPASAVGVTAAGAAIGGGGIASAAAVGTAAAAGYSAGSMVSCEDGSMGCY